MLINEQFNVLERDISLAFPEEVCYNSPKFDFYYDRIKNLLMMTDCKIIGFALSNDAGF